MPSNDAPHPQNPAPPRPMSPVVWLLGLSGTGKTTLALRLLESARAKGLRADLIDGDLVRDFFADRADYSRENRISNIQRIVFAALLLSRNDVLTIVSNISPYEETRRFARRKLPRYCEIYLKASLEDCARRDPKGLYRRAREGQNPGMIGVDAPFEEPRSPDLAVDTGRLSEDDSFAEILRFLGEKGLL
ncbi:MAG: adenylyl-sulfate kinase [Elusimicrobia bacterium]|nr:adenylyl-sulfate kinase [Elusimicrobiota bacterium]